MSEAKVLLAFEKGEYHVRVSGRANFECCPPLRSMIKNFDGNIPAGVFVDLGGCSGMDSTFMGILTMIALKGRKLGFSATIENADDNCKRLLNGLGIKNLFIYTAPPSQDSKKLHWDETKELSGDKIKVKTIIDAHETLIDANKDNAERFKNVVSFAKKDLEEREKKDQGGGQQP
jgi:anti-anti-sigma regulatory factor